VVVVVLVVIVVVVVYWHARTLLPALAFVLLSRPLSLSLVPYLFFSLLLPFSISPPNITDWHSSPKELSDPPPPPPHSTTFFSPSPQPTTTATTFTTRHKHTDSSGSNIGSTGVPSVVQPLSGGEEELYNKLREAWRSVAKGEAPMDVAVATTSPITLTHTRSSSAGKTRAKLSVSRGRQVSHA